MVCQFLRLLKIGILNKTKDKFQIDQGFSQSLQWLRYEKMRDYSEFSDFMLVGIGHQHHQALVHCSVDDNELETDLINYSLSMSDFLFQLMILVTWKFSGHYNAL